MLALSILTRIFSNSYLNVCQKVLTNNGERASTVNFYTYLGLTLAGLILCPLPLFTHKILINALIMGCLGALGNYFIIKALSIGELSTLAPINSYKPVVALILGFFLLKEIPDITAMFGIVLIIIGTLFLTNTKFLYSKACTFRILALIFSGCEAIFIKKAILLSNISTAFLYWAAAGLIFSSLFIRSFRLEKSNIKHQLILIFMVGLMQYSTNYVFSKMNVSYALALFQLSTLLSVFLGVNIFKEEGLMRKLIASTVMIIGAILVIHPV